MLQSQNDDASASSSSGDSANRFDERLLDDMECSVHFMDAAEDFLPEYFPVDSVKLINSSTCEVCSETFTTKLGSRPRRHCRKCGVSVCDLCSQSQRRLMKSETTKYRVCDLCDHLISNVQFDRKLKEDTNKKQNITKVLQENIGDMREKIKIVEEQNKKYQEILELKEKELHDGKLELDNRLLQNKGRVDEVDKRNEDLRRQLQEIEAKEKQLQAELQKKIEIHKAVEDER